MSDCYFCLPSIPLHRGERIVRFTFDSLTRDCYGIDTHGLSFFDFPQIRSPADLDPARSDPNPTGVRRDDPPVFEEPRDIQHA